MIREIERKAASGYSMLAVLLLITAGFIYALVRMIAAENVLSSSSPSWSCRSS